MRFLKIILFLIMTSPPLYAQINVTTTGEELLELPDSLEIFSYKQFLSLTFLNHPVVKQAQLNTDLGEQEVRMAKGNLDPKLTADWAVKDFKDTEYFNIFNSTLKIPTWFPIDPKVSVDRNRGVFLNPERFISEDTDNWQFQLGVELPIGRGLLIDPRRAAIKQSIQIQNMLEADRIKAINKVLFEAGKAYWDWYSAFYRYRLIYRSIEISREIFDRVKINYDFGEASVIDTLQAGITLQNRLIDLQAVKIEMITARLNLSNYIWTENEEPLELTDLAAPFTINFTEDISTDYIDSLRFNAMVNHPELLKLDAKMNQLNIKNKLARENLKPTVNLEYNFIDQPLSPTGDFTQFGFGSNYKFGVNFSYPLLIRKERSKNQMTRIELSQTDYELNSKSLEIKNNLESAYNEFINTDIMIEQQIIAIDSYEKLLEAELLNLELGESDLFKINFQQDKLIESQTKALKLFMNREKLNLKMRWTSGVKNLDLENFLEIENDLQQ